MSYCGTQTGVLGSATDALARILEDNHGKTKQHLSLSLRFLVHFSPNHPLTLHFLLFNLCSCYTRKDRRVIDAQACNNEIRY